jgi:hypothetical protein
VSVKKGNNQNKDFFPLVSFFLKKEMIRVDGSRTGDAEHVGHADETDVKRRKGEGTVHKGEANKPRGRVKNQPNCATGIPVCSNGPNSPRPFYATGAIGATAGAAMLG